MTWIRRVRFRSLALSFCCMMLACTAGCFTFSSYQSAHILGDGEVRHTLAVTRNDLVEDGQADGGWTLLELQRRAPVVPGRVDGSLKFSLLRADEGNGLGLVIGGDVKAGLWPDHLAAMLPVSVMAGDTDFSTFDCYPTLIGSTTIGPHLELTSSASRHFLVKGDNPTMDSFTVGFGVGRDVQRWSIRPEFGWLRFGDDHWSVAQFGIALQGTTLFGGGR
jgi:hypothetical protein